MRVAIISEYNHLSSIGGTEHYTEILSQKLCSFGIELIFISQGLQKEALAESVIRVEDKQYKMLLLPRKDYTAEEIRLNIISHTWRNIKNILDSFKPDIIHIHTLSTFFNIRHIEAASKTFPNLIFTSHVALHFCPKGDMIFKNEKPCTGKIGMNCAACLFSIDFRTGVSGVLKGNILKKKRLIKIMSSLGVFIVSTSEWQKKQLIENGILNNKIKVIRQALNVSSLQILQNNLLPSSKIRIGFLGRLSFDKGSALLYDLLEQFRNDSNFHFILGIPNNSDAHELKKLERLVGSNSTGNIEIHRTVNSKTKAGFFSSIDALFIPSFCMETGPFVLLESVFYGKRVIAPNTGGPVEFHEEYPEFVHLYDWNDKNAVIHLFKQLPSLIKNPIPAIDYVNINSEDAFLQSHLNLYNELLSVRA